MKKKSLLFLTGIIFLLLANAVWSEVCDSYETGRCAELKTIDCDNLQMLDPQTLAITQKNCDDMSSVDSELLLLGLASEEISGKSILAEEVSNRLQVEEIQDLFNNETNLSTDARVVWWDDLGLETIGAKVKFFDFDWVTTDGKYQTIFKPEDFAGDTVLENGCLLSNSNIFCDTIVFKNKNNIRISYQNENSMATVTPESLRAGISYTVEGDVSIQIDGQNIVSSDEYTLAFTNDEYVFKSGLVQLEKDGLTREISGDFSTDWRTYKLSADGTYSEYTDRNSWYVNSGSSGLTITEGSECFTVPCINVKMTSDNYRELNVVPDFYSDLDIYNSGDMIEKINVEKVTGSNKVIYNDYSGTKLNLQKGGVSVDGDPMDVSSEVTYTYTNSDGVEHEISFSGGMVTLCSECKLFGSAEELKKELLGYYNSDEGKSKIKQLKSCSRNVMDDAFVWLYENKDRRGTQTLIYESIMGATTDYNEFLNSQGQDYRLQIDPAFLYTGAVVEGLGSYVKERGDSQDKRFLVEVDGYYHLGLDDFGTNYKNLQKGGFYPQNIRTIDLQDVYQNYFGEVLEDVPFPERQKHVRLQLEPKFDFITRKTTNELGRTVISGSFFSVKDALYAKAAEYSWRKSVLLKDMNSIGIDYSSMNRDEIDFWNYVYYNAGIGTGKNMLEKWHGLGYLDDVNYLCDNPDTSYDAPHRYSSQRITTLQLIRDTGVFPDYYQPHSSGLEEYYVELIDGFRQVGTLEAPDNGRFSSYGFIP